MNRRFQPSITPHHTQTMKPIHTLPAILFGIACLHAPVEARDLPRGADTTKKPKAAAPSAPTATPKRNPATSSTPARPAAKPVPQPGARPAAKPAEMPKPKPAGRPSVERPTTRPASIPEKKPDLKRPDSKPALTRPDSKPGNLPDKKPNLTRPDGKPDLTRPETKPGKLPDKKPDLNRPDNKPDLQRPGTDRNPLGDRPGVKQPSTLPGMGTLPGLPGNSKPGIADRDLPDLKGGDNNRLNLDNNRTNNSVHIDQVNVGGRNKGLNRPATLPVGKRNWDANKWGGKNSVWGNNVTVNNSVNVNIDNNFRRSNNFSYRPNYWGAKPWWGAGSSHAWHHGHWGYGYNSRYYSSHWYFHDNNDFAKGFMWGIAVWSMGNMIYDMGYQSYRNPYPAPPVQHTTINYTQPVSVTAAANPPGDDATTTLAETQSAAALERSRDAFKQGDYVTAMAAVDEALGFTSGDVTLHEYRALVLFALGKYADAAGVLNPVLASGPGWGWETMVGFYHSASVYQEQLAKLEGYVTGTPDSAQGHFLLGYHYLVGGHTDTAYAQFDKTATLQPADSIARQLRDLTKGSLAEAPEPAAETAVRPEPMPTEKLVGIWVSDRGQDGKITFTLTADGNYTWSYLIGGKATDMKGTYGLDDQGLLVLSTDDSQMVSEVSLKDDRQMKFTLVGAPDGDPGLDFTKG